MTRHFFECCLSSVAKAPCTWLFLCTQSPLSLTSPTDDTSVRPRRRECHFLVPGFGMQADVKVVAVQSVSAHSLCNTLPVQGIAVQREKTT